MKSDFKIFTCFSVRLQESVFFIESVQTKLTFNHIWLPRLYGTSFLAHLLKLELSLLTFFLSSKTDHLSQWNQQLHPIYLLSIKKPWSLYQISLDKYAPWISMFSSISFLCRPRCLIYLSFLSPSPYNPPFTLPPSRWKRRDLEESVPQESVALKSSRSLHGLPKNTASSFPQLHCRGQMGPA